jgi:hypothetical protein
LQQPNGNYYFIAHRPPLNLYSVPNPPIGIPLRLLNRSTPTSVTHLLKLANE